MWKLLLVGVCLGATQASIVKRQIEPAALLPSAQQFFTDSFTQALFIEVMAANDITLAEKNSLDGDVLTCEDDVTTAREICKSCAASACDLTLEAVDAWFADIDGVKSSEVVRRAELSDEARGCMKHCDSCDPFLQDTAYRINTICGPEILQRIESLQAEVSKIVWIVAAALDTDNPIVVETTTAGAFDVATWTIEYVFVKARFPGDRIYEFVCANGYDLNDPGQTAVHCASDYWDIYDLILINIL